MIIDLRCYPTKEVDSAWRHDGAPFTGERLLKMMDGPFYVNGKPRRVDKAFIQPPQGNTLHNFTNDHLDGREGIRAYMAYTVELVKKYPERFIGCFVYNPRYGVQDGGVYCFEPFQWAMELANVYCESGWCLQSRIVEFAKDLPKHKILFGTDTPPNEPGMWMRLLEVLCMEPPQGMNLDEETLEDYLGNNTARMIGLKPTPAP